MEAVAINFKNYSVIFLKDSEKPENPQWKYRPS